MLKKTDPTTQRQKPWSCLCLRLWKSRPLNGCSCGSIKRVLRIRIHASDPALCSELSFQRHLAPSGIQQGLTKQTPFTVNGSFRARAEREESGTVARQADRAAAPSPPGIPPSGAPGRTGRETRVLCTFLQTAWL